MNTQRLLGSEQIPERHSFFATFYCITSSAEIYEMKSKATTSPFLASFMSACLDFLHVLCELWGPSGVLWTCCQSAYCLSLR